LIKEQEDIEKEIAQGGQDMVNAEFMFSDQEHSKARGNNLAYKRAWLRNVKARRKSSQLDLQPRDMILMRGNIHRFLNMA
jgi:hypothetical protein